MLYSKVKIGCIASWNQHKINIVPWKSPHYHWADVVGIDNDDADTDGDNDNEGDNDDDDDYNGDDDDDEQARDEDDNDDDGDDDYNDNDDNDNDYDNGDDDDNHAHDEDEDDNDDDDDDGDDDYDNHDHNEDDVFFLLWKRRENEWQIMIVLKHCPSCITINQLVNDVTFECDSFCLHLWTCLRNRKTKRANASCPINTILLNFHLKFSLLFAYLIRLLSV